MRNIYSAFSKSWRNMSAIAVMFTGFGISQSVQAQSYVNSYPWMDDFESNTTCSTNSCSNPCSINNWGQSGTKNWLIDQNGTTSSNTGPNVDHNPGTSSGNYVVAETSFPCSSGSDTWILESPFFDLSGITFPKLTFWYHLQGSTMGNMHIDARVGSTTAWGLDVIPQWTDNQNLWQEQNVFLTAFANTDSVQFRIRYEGNTSYEGDAAFDDFSLVSVEPFEAGLNAIVEPANAFNLTSTEVVSVEILNNGTDTISTCSVSYQVNGGTVITETYSGQIFPNTVDTFDFAATTDLSALDTFNIVAWVTLAGDNQNGNDTATKQLVNVNRVSADVILNPVQSCGLTSGMSVEFQMTNLGTNSLTDTTLTMSLYHNGTLIVTDTIGNDTLHVQSSYQHTFTQTVDLSGNGEHNIWAVVSAYGDANAADDTVSVGLFNLNSLPYFSSFENNAGGFYTYGTNSSWEWGVPSATNIDTASDGIKAWVTNVDGSYNPNEDSYLEAPCFDFSGDTTDPSVRFSIIRASENSWDGMNLEMSLDSGNTWTVVGTIGSGQNWYNDGTINGLSTDTGWTGNNGNFYEWITAEHVLTGSAGFAQVKLRFHFGSDGSVNYEGLGIDEFAVSRYPKFELPNFACDGQEYGLALGNGTYTYTVLESQGVVITHNSPTFVMNAEDSITSKTVILNYTNEAGFSGVDTAVVQIIPHVSISGDTEYCEGSSTLLTASLKDETGSQLAGTTFIWNGTTQGSTNSVNAAGWYVVEAQDPFGCNLSDSVMVSENPSPVVDLGNDTATCQGNSVVLSANSGFVSYQWTGAGDGQSIVVTTPGNYGVTVTDNKGCTGSDDVLVTINPNPIVDLGNDTNIVPNVQINFDAGSGYTSYEWNTGATTQTIDYVTGYSDITLSVTVTDANGCKGSDDILIINPEPLSTSVVENGMEVKSFPNPVEKELTISLKMEQPRNVIIEIVDVTGRSVLTENLGSVSVSNTIINTEKLVSGTYFMNVKIDGEMKLNQKLIKE